MYVHDEARLVFLAMPRTASLSTGRAIIESGGRRAGNHHELKPFDHGWTTFTVVRHHFGALVSWHTSETKRGRPPLTPDWIRDLLTREFYFPEPGQFWGMYGIAADLVLKFESLEADLARLFDARGVPFHGLPLPRTGIPNRPHYRDLVPPKARAFMEEMFEDEMAHYGYEW